MAEEIIPKFAEDDDLARAKAFWNENGKPILLAITLGLASIGGFNYWINYQQEQGEVTSLLYDQVRETTGDWSEIPEINDLKINYPESVYTTLATFKLVKLLVEENKLTEARDELEWILENSADEIILHIALHIGAITIDGIAKIYIVRRPINHLDGNNICNHRCDRVGHTRISIRVVLL